jgi:alginate O-acetyltransferase complex protein AlgI
MLFNSYIFIFVFLPFTLFGYYLISKKKLQLSFLLFASVSFYAYWSTKYVFFLLLTVILDFYVAKAIFNSKTKGRKKLLLAASMTVNLSILAFFKYYNLVAGTIDNAFNLMGGTSHLFPIFNLILPIGISFYTFQSMSYVIDVYRGTSNAHANLLSFAGYVTLFPHQISGPLVRHNQIVPQLENTETYFFHWENFWKGCSFFILGLSKKILIADLLATIVAPLVTGMSSSSNTEAILAMLGYSMQLYFDFSGYSDMAVGLGLMMNIQFPQNFNSPYKSKSITEFWQRWHISLSSWLRDYLYISLGGNRNGKLKTYRNLMLTMVIGGLWHGGNWTFAAWGFFHGLMLTLEKFFRERNLRFITNKTLSLVFTFFIVNIGWVFFRSPNFSTAALWLQKIFLLNAGKPTWDLISLPERFQDRFFVALAVGTLLAFFAKNTWEINLKPSMPKAVTLGFLFALCLMFMGDESPFLYFQF